MKKERTFLSPAELAINDGQLSWLPRNPRQWTREDIDKTMRSIAEDRDFLEDRPLLVVEGVVFGGNLRLTASKELALDRVPVVIYTPENENDEETIRRRSIKDNGTFGAWDADTLADEWDDAAKLEGWGVPSWIFAGMGDNDLDLELREGSAFEKMAQDIQQFQVTFVFDESDREAIESYIKANTKDVLAKQIVELCRSREAK